MTHSTISQILKDEVRVKKTVKSLPKLKAIITRQRKGLFYEVKARDFKTLKHVKPGAGSDLFAAILSVKMCIWSIFLPLLKLMSEVIFQILKRTLFKP